jgi:hypothetical protein
MILRVFFRRFTDRRGKTPNFLRHQFTLGRTRATRITPAAWSIHCDKARVNLSAPIGDFGHVARGNLIQIGTAPERDGMESLGPSAYINSGDNDL